MESQVIRMEKHYKFWNVLVREEEERMSIRTELIYISMMIA